MARGVGERVLSESRAWCIAVRVRRPLLHGLVLLVGTLLCAAVSSVQIPAASPDPFTGHREHLAYGYLYYPLVVVPVITSFTSSPLAWIEQHARPRSDRVDAALFAASGMVAGVGALLVAIVARDPGGWVVALTNMFGVMAILGISLRLLEPQWAWIPAFGYAAAGLTLAASPLWILNREESVARMIGAIVLFATVVVLIRAGFLRRPA